MPVDGQSNKNGLWLAVIVLHCLTMQKEKC